MIRYRTIWDNLCQIVMLLGFAYSACTSDKSSNQAALSAYYFPLADFPPLRAHLHLHQPLDSLARSGNLAFSANRSRSDGESYQ